MPVLLLDGERVVKSQRFKSPTYVGDVRNVVRIFNDKEVDELVVLDIMATRRGTGPDLSLISEIAGECLMPLAYGGGVRSPDDAAALHSIGVEKVIIQSAFLRRPDILQELASRFGSQAVVCSVDVTRDRRGGVLIYDAARRRPIRQMDLLQHVRSVERSGAGELLLGAVHRDGTLAGPDLELVSAVSAAVSIPVVSVGGTRSLNDVKDALQHGAHAVGAGAFLVFQGVHRAVLVSYPSRSELDTLMET